MVTHIKNKLAATFGRQHNSMRYAIHSTLSSNGSLNKHVVKPKAQIKNARLKTGLIAG